MSRLFVALAAAVLVVFSTLVLAECPYKHMASSGAGHECPHKKAMMQQKQQSAGPRIGKPAPDFEGVRSVNPDGSFGKVSLSDYKGKWVVLIFVPLAHTFNCPTEALSAALEVQSKLTEHNTQLLLVSVDSHFSLRLWSQMPVNEGGLGKMMNFPLLSDMTKNLARSYNVLIEDGDDAGVALRGTFVIDPSGILRQITINDLPVSRNIPDIVRVVRGYQHAAKHGDVCPTKWMPDDSDGISSQTIKPSPDESKAYFEKLAKELAV